MSKHFRTLQDTSTLQKPRKALPMRVIGTTMGANNMGLPVIRSVVNTFFRVFAYLCIWTTPFQIMLVLWGSWIVATTDFRVLSFTTLAFVYLHLRFFIPFIDWLYTWVWNAYLDFVLSLPFIFLAGFKAIVSTWLGFWILKKIN